MFFTDVFTLDAPRRTNDGYLVASVRVARTGIQEYSGREVDPDNKHGLRDKATVRVWRPEAEVFSKDALASIAHRPVTIDHPKEAVTSKNWADYSVGTVGGDIARDGEFVRAQIALMDEYAIKQVEDGKRQISQGYNCDIVAGDGMTPEGLQFDAKQTNIRANHTAIVGLARGGPELRIGDSQVATKTIVFDGLPLEITDAGEMAIAKLQGTIKTITDAATAADAKHATELSTSAAKIATQDAEIATLKAAQLTGDKLDAAVAERAQLLADAKTIAGASIDIKGTNADIKKRVVLAKLGDAYKDRDAAFFDAAFELQVVGLGTRDMVRDAIRNGGHVDLADGAKKVQDAHAEMVRNLKGETKAA